MPYIKQHERSKFIIPAVSSGGELQYMIAAMIQAHLERKEEVRYKDLEEILGALAGAQHEFYREVVAPYEDEKMEENGGVYDPSSFGNGEYS